MCSFVILLLLLCRRCDNCDRCEHHGCLQERKFEDYSRERECGCSACEEAVNDELPIKGREDIWSTYRNAPQERNCK